MNKTSPAVPMSQLPEAGLAPTGGGMRQQLLGVDVNFGALVQVNFSPLQQLLLEIVKRLVPNGGLNANMYSTAGGGAASSTAALLGGAPDRLDELFDLFSDQQRQLQKLQTFVAEIVPNKGGENAAGGAPGSPSTRSNVSSPSAAAGGSETLHALQNEIRDDKARTDAFLECIDSVGGDPSGPGSRVAGFADVNTVKALMERMSDLEDVVAAHTAGHADGKGDIGSDASGDEAALETAKSASSRVESRVASASRPGSRWSARGNGFGYDASVMESVQATVSGLESRVQQLHAEAMAAEDVAREDLKALRGRMSLLEVTSKALTIAIPKPTALAAAPSGESLSPSGKKGGASRKKRARRGSDAGAHTDDPVRDSEALVHLMNESEAGGDAAGPGKSMKRALRAIFRQLQSATGLVGEARAAAEEAKSESKALREVQRDHSEWRGTLDTMVRDLRARVTILGSDIREVDVRLGNGQMAEGTRLNASVNTLSQRFASLVRRVTSTVGAPAGTNVGGTSGLASTSTGHPAGTMMYSSLPDAFGGAAVPCPVPVDRAEPERRQEGATAEYASVGAVTAVARVMNDIVVDMNGLREQLAAVESMSESAASASVATDNKVKVVERSVAEVIHNSDQMTSRLNGIEQRWYRQSRGGAAPATPEKPSQRSVGDLATTSPSLAQPAAVVAPGSLLSTSSDGRRGRTGSVSIDSSLTIGGSGMTGQELVAKVLSLDVRATSMSTKLATALKEIEFSGARATGLSERVESMADDITGLAQGQTAANHVISKLRSTKQDKGALVDLRKEFAKSVRDVRVLQQAVARKLVESNAGGGGGGGGGAQRGAKQGVSITDEQLQLLNKLNSRVSEHGILIDQLLQTKADRSVVEELVVSKADTICMEDKANRTYVEQLVARLRQKLSDLTEAHRTDVGQMGVVTGALNAVRDLLGGKAESGDVEQLRQNVERLNSVAFDGKWGDNSAMATAGMNAQGSSTLMEGGSIIRTPLMPDTRCVACDRLILETTAGVAHLSGGGVTASFLPTLSTRTGSPPRFVPSPPRGSSPGSGLSGSPPNAGSLLHAKGSEFPVTRTPQRPMTMHDMSHLRHTHALPFAAAGTITHGKRTKSGAMPHIPGGQEVMREAEFIASETSQLVGAGLGRPRTSGGMLRRRHSVGDVSAVTGHSPAQQPPSPTGGKGHQTLPRRGSGDPRMVDVRHVTQGQQVEHKPPVNQSSAPQPAPPSHQASQPSPLPPRNAPSQSQRMGRPSSVKREEEERPTHDTGSPSKAVDRPVGARGLPP